MVWAVLVLAGLLEVLGAVGLKFAAGFTRVGWSLVVIVAFGASFFLLATAAKVLPIGTAYAIWTGIGSAGTALFGMLWMGESRNPPRVASLALIVAGSVGLKLFS